MKKLLFAVVALVPTLVLANPGPYVQGQFGWYNGVAASLNGGYLWGDNTLNYGVEVEALGSTVILGDSYNLALLGILKYNIAPNWVIFGKAGVAYVTQNNNFLVSESNNAFGPEVALGAGYQFNPQWELDFTISGIFAYSHTTNPGDPNYFNPISTSTVGLIGVTYHFA